MTLAFIVVATPVNAVIGWLGAYPGVILSLVVCRFTLNSDEREDTPFGAAEP